MFNLIYRDGAPENTGHYEVFEKDAGKLEVGKLVSVANGKASAYTSGKPYGMVAIDAADEDDAVAVLRITDDMIFKTGVSSDPVVHVAKGDLKGFNSSEITNDSHTGWAFEITEVVDPGVSTFEAHTGRIVEGRFVAID